MPFDCVVRQLRIRVAAATIFRALFLESTHSYWLDSSRNDADYARFFFMGDVSGPYSHYIRYRVGEAVSVRSSSGEMVCHDEDIFAFLERMLAASRVRNRPALPFSFCGG